MPLNLGVVVNDRRSIPASAECVKSRSSTHGESVVSMPSDLVLTGSDLDVEVISVSEWRLFAGYEIVFKVILRGRLVHSTIIT